MDVICHYCDEKSIAKVKSCCGHLSPICGECDRGAAQHSKCLKCNGQLTPEEDKALLTEYQNAQDGLDYWCDYPDYEWVDIEIARSEEDEEYERFIASKDDPDDPEYDRRRRDERDEEIAHEDRLLEEALERDIAMEEM